MIYRVSALRSRVVYVVLGLTGLTLATPVVVRNDYYLDTFIQILLWGAAASAWNIAGGYAGQFSLGHAAFLGVGAYTSTILFASWGLSPWVGMVGGGSISAFLALILGTVCFRLRGPFFAMVTLAFGEVMRITALNMEITGAGTPLFVPMKPAFQSMVFEGKVSYLYLMYGLVLMIVLVSRAIERSRLGYHLVAFREDEDAARSLGVESVQVRLVALVVSAFLTSLCGTFYAQYFLFIDSWSVMNVFVSAQLALVTIVGGLSTSMGPIFGAFLVIPLAQFLRATIGGQYAGAHLFVYGLVLIIVVLFLPEGLWVSIRRKAQAILGS
jgi:branched-chain amino acid transport system permease protein